MSSTDIVIRPMSSKDLPVVIAIENRVHLSPWKQSHFETSLAANHIALVSTAPDDCIVGYAIMSFGGGEAELLNIAVDENYQRRGLARSLIAESVKLIDGRADNFYLEVRESNVSAQRLYESIGFNQVGVRPRYYPATLSSANAGGEDALIYAMTLL